MQDIHFRIAANSGSRLLERPAIRRKITPEVGRGLEKLAHAVEYLEDEFVYNNVWAVSEDRGRLDAIRLLATLNRELYLECGVDPTLRERVRALFRKPRSTRS